MNKKLIIDYTSVSEASHMCGHDGHMTILLGAISKILDEREIIPSNCILRAIFQPGEEGYGGADLMIDEGVLDGVSEIYGLHNVPWDNVGEVYVTDGNYQIEYYDYYKTMTEPLKDSG